MVKKKIFIILVIAVTYGILCICLLRLIHWEASHLILVILLILLIPLIPWIQYLSSRKCFSFTEVLNLFHNFSNSMNSMNFPIILSKDYLKAIYHTGDIQTLCNSSNFMNFMNSSVRMNSERRAWCNSCNCLNSLNLWVMIVEGYCWRRGHS